MKSDSIPGRQFTPEQLSLCACPKCKGILVHNELDNTLDCTACRVQYPVRAGIPVLLQDHNRAHQEEHT